MSAAAGGRFRSLDLVYSLTVADPGMAALLDDLLAATVTNEPAVLDVRVDTVDDELDVRVDDEIVCTTTAPSHALARVLWEINQRGLERSSPSLLLHASAVARGSHVVVLPGRSGSGKSTLTAAFVTAGFAYLTDDTLALDTTGGVRPVVKPLALGRDVLGMFPALEVPERAPAYMGDEWFVTPEMLVGAGNAHDPSVTGTAPQVVVFPTYAADADDCPQAMTRAEALLGLAENSFNFHERAPLALELLARVVRDCDCYRFGFSRPATVVDFVGALLAPRSAETETRP